jgi:hypothetical protein
MQPPTRVAFLGGCVAVVWSTEDQKAHAVGFCMPYLSQPRVLYTNLIVVNIVNDIISRWVRWRVGAGCYLSSQPPPPIFQRGTPWVIVETGGCCVYATITTHTPLFSC